MKDMNYIALAKGKERYVFIFEDGREDEILREFGRQAADPELSLSWYDAAYLSRQVRER